MQNQRVKIVAMTLLSTLLTFDLAIAAEKMGLKTYQIESVKPGQTVCELLDAKTNQSRCYSVINWTTKITPENDKSDRLKKGAMSPSQGAFSEVLVGELISTVTPGQKASSVDIYVKVAWKGQRGGTLNTPLSGQHVVQGKMKLDEQGRFQFELVSIPDLTFIGSFNPRLEVAEIFGRNADKQAYELEHDIKSWMQDVLNSVLPAVYNQVLITPKK